MKTIVLALTALLLVRGAAPADSTVPNQLVLETPTAAVSPVHSGVQSMPALTLAPLPGTDALSPGLATSGTSNFAQFDTPAKSLPVSPTMVFALIALFIVGMRLMGVRQAHAMAMYERHSHHGKAQMFRSLHEERAARG